MCVPKLLGQSPRFVRGQPVLYKPKRVFT